VEPNGYEWFRNSHFYIRGIFLKWSRWLFQYLSQKETLKSTISNLNNYENSPEYGHYGHNLLSLHRYNISQLAIFILWYIEDSDPVNAMKSIKSLFLKQFSHIYSSVVHRRHIKLNFNNPLIFSNQFDSNPNFFFSNFLKCKCLFLGRDGSQSHLQGLEGQPGQRAADGGVREAGFRRK
jgi:hypothetical protein